jgi:hypothetical protein
MQDWKKNTRYVRLPIEFIEMLDKHRKLIELLDCKTVNRTDFIRKMLKKIENAIK